MKLFSFKRLIIKSFIFLITFSFIPHTLAYADVEAKGGDSLTTSGFSGIINVASAQTIKNGVAISLLTSTDFSSTALLPRFAFGFLDCLEVAGGVDFPFHDDSFMGGTVGVKWMFWSNENIFLGISGNVQFNGKQDGTNIDGQILFHTSWNLNENFQTTAVFGKSFGQTRNDWTNWDFGMGLQWWFINNKVMQLALALDFSNYDYRAYAPYIPAVGSIIRGNVSAAARFGFLNKMIMFDIGGTNILDSEAALYVSIATSLNF